MTTKQEVEFNRVRCHLQVISIADIATGCGIKIQHTYMIGEIEIKSTFEWQKEEPHKKDFSIWKSIY